MGWNRDGTFTLTNEQYSGDDLWEQARGDDRYVRSDDMDAFSVSLKEGLQECIQRDGFVPAAANLPMAGFRHTNVGAATRANEYSTAGQVQKGVLNFVPAQNVGGTGDDITLALTPAAVRYDTDLLVAFIVEAANTGPVQANVNGLGLQPVRKNGGADELEADDLRVGELLVMRYDGAAFQALSRLDSIAGVLGSRVMAVRNEREPTAMVRFWFGSRAQHDALLADAAANGTELPATLYVIT